MDGAGDEISLERLEADLVSHAAMIAAATCRWLGWLAEYDRRRGWAVWGCKSAAHWLSFACGMSLRTARDHVRVARGLEELATVRAAFGAGELSFSKARALTRLERPIDEQAMVDLARVTTAAQLDRVVAGHRRIDGQTPDRPSDHGGSAEPSVDDGGWSKRCYRQRHLPDGMVEISLVVPVDVAAMIDASVDARVDEILADAGTDGPVSERVAERGGWSAIQADAAVELLGGSAEPTQVELDIDLTITMPADTDPGAVDPTDTATLATGARLPSEVTRRHSCDATARITTTNHTNGRHANDRHTNGGHTNGCHTNGHGHGPSIGVGRRTRIVPRWLRRRIERRDDYTCRFPACSSNRRLHAHHLVHWSDNGPTDLNNLLLLCNFHHHLVHEGGWTLTGTATNHHIARPDGTPLPTTPPRNLHAAADTPELDPATVADPNALFATAGAGERYDHNYIVDVTWTVNDDHRKRLRGTAEAAIGVALDGQPNRGVHRDLGPPVRRASLRRPSLPRPSLRPGSRRCRRAGPWPSPPPRP